MDRGAYFFWGVLLAAVKFNLDRVIGAVWFDQQWTIFDAEIVRLYLWQSPLHAADEPYFFALLAVSLPFMWTGTMLTLRRLRSLNWSSWLVLLFFMPVVKLIFFALLCLLPAREERAKPPVISESLSTIFITLVPTGVFGSAITAVLLTAALAILAAWLGTSVFKDYGWSIFVGLPFCMGFLSVLIHSFRQRRSFGSCVLVSLATAAIAGAGLLLFAIEGLICIIMAAPLAAAIALIGGIVAYAVQETCWRQKDSSRLFCVAVLALPLTMGLEHVVPPPLPLLKVKTFIVVDAPPEKVWQNVVAFSDLPPPKEMIFKLGVAYPIRAEIHGCGVGAVRHCNFSTGPFVEPIEVWDEPRLLKFSVTKNPEPMQEWTPYRDVHPAHLDGYLESCGGQFRLERLDGNRTLLEGTTWYYHHMWPSKYWQLWSDKIIHTIHFRVLNHVKELSEKKEP